MTAKPYTTNGHEPAGASRYRAWSRWVLVCSMIVVLSSCGGKKDAESETIQLPDDVPEETVMSAETPQDLPEDDGTASETVADGAPAPADEAASKEDEKLKEIAKQRFEIEMAREPRFDRQAALRKIVLEKHKIDINVLPADRLSNKDVEALIDAKALEKASEEYTAEERQDVVLQAEKEYPLFQKGDMVTVTTKVRGKVSGVVAAIYPTKVKIGHVLLLISDISTPDPACFNEEVCRKRREHFVRVNFDIGKDDYMRAARKRLTKKVYRQQGFLPVGNDWVHVQDLIDAEIAPLVDEMATAHQAEREQRVRKRVEEQMRDEGLTMSDVGSSEAQSTAIPADDDAAADELPSDATSDDEFEDDGLEEELDDFFE